ncbi:DUF1223 domain-containing protein [Schlegelella sp. S2-27]|uniref:DUF1223 domain-containing protein n=1 Tax=Caldimonas mangrovi TaxID=2944811 RepID=A0ABT0YR63_9BURK|nr:DUF1223 domain-containing protein [Caldimonas mangrovi]MCM5681220.1 DUF1223 domain-containing protein [Caldimonas mangrovi]
MNTPVHVLAAALACAAGPLQAQATCQAHGGPTVPTVVELYTSEGCSSCPPADRWLTQRQSGPGVIALAFHVDYWDRLGWPDRYASPAYTQRQRQWQHRLGLGFVYTPQVVLDGEDRKDWHRITRLPGPGAALADASLRRLAAGTYEAEIRPHAGAPALGAYWAVTEDGHRTTVKAGENDGATLHHDAVVRHYRELPMRSAHAGATQHFTLQVPPGERARRVVLVVHDAATGRPVQAVSLGC